MARRGARAWLARFAAPAAFLLAATVAVLIVRAGLRSDEPAPRRSARETTTTTRTTARPPPATMTRPRTTATRPARPQRFYVVETGDTLATIADEYDTTVERLLELNPDVDPVALSIGQRVRVP